MYYFAEVLAKKALFKGNSERTDSDGIVTQNEAFTPKLASLVYDWSVCDSTETKCMYILISSINYFITWSTVFQYFIYNVLLHHLCYITSSIMLYYFIYNVLLLGL